MLDSPIDCYCLFIRLFCLAGRLGWQGGVWRLEELLGEDANLPAGIHVSQHTLAVDQEDRRKQLDTMLSREAHRILGAAQRGPVNGLSAEELAHVLGILVAEHGDDG